jgi:hypothetical protein
MLFKHALYPQNLRGKKNVRIKLAKGTTSQFIALELARILIQQTVTVVFD